MNFRIVVFQFLLLAALIFGLLPLAEAQSTAGGQRIVFSSPDGQIASNAPVPMVQAPEPRETPNLPAGEVTVHEFADPLDAAMYPAQPLPVLQQPNAPNRDDFRDSTDVRKEMGLLSPGQIMNVPTPEQIFGLPEKSLDAQKELLQSENGATNELTFGTNSISTFAEPSWARIWTQAPGSTGSSNTTTRTSGFFGRLFENVGNDEGFGNHDANGDDQLLSASQPQQQSSWGSALNDGVFTHPPSDGEIAPTGFTPPPGEPSPELTSQSPFAAPQVSTMDALPKVPSLPSLPGQNDKFAQPASTPSWAPKPPPWTQPQTPFGTPAPLNPALNH